jgi:class 3 adenylate cyclase/tetratricopeptide (TPR) repeat protein
VKTCVSCGHESADAARFCEACGTAFADASTERRKVVTVLFCDVVGSTSLGESADPEALRALLARYFVRMKKIVERHGGSVEKFIGDAVMAVFGVPAVHEDDALRACRAALEMREAFADLGIEGRIGLSTGEVVTGTEERLATGDAVNVGARLEQAAHPGEVLLGQATLALVRDAVDVEAVQPLTLKGKADPVPAFRLLGTRDATERRHVRRLVGRERELALLRDAWERVLAEQRCALFTIVGEAGIGKSRLVAEALTSVEATIVRGRCLPYGEGITYWPATEVLKQLGRMPDDDAAAAVIRSLFGETTRPTSAEEIAWAFRKAAEQVATEGPLLIVFDDIQWGEDAFRDLIEHVALLSSGVPILLLCMARPDLTERRPDWPVALRLEPLRDDAVDELLPEQLPRDLRTRIAHAAGGNPLFVEEMLAMAAEGGADVAVPPTLRVLLAARLDQLGAAERSVLERGSIEGEVFHRGAVQALAPEVAQVTPRLAGLVRKELIRPERPLLAGDDGFRFRHLLIRDAAYEGLPKARRADLHGRFAAWLEEHGTDLAELDELLGYHLEQACSYRAELGMPRHDELAAAATRRLIEGGRRAHRRQDYRAAAALFERAAALLRPDETDLVLETELGEVLAWLGRTDEALRRADANADRAARAGDRVGELCARIRAGVHRLFAEPEGAREALEALLDQALPELEVVANDLALYVAYHALGEVAGSRGRPDEQLRATERALMHAERAGYEPSSMIASLAWCRFAGTTRVSDLLAWLEEIEQHAPRDQFLFAYRGWSLARLGRFDEARAIIAEARAQQAERGGGILLANLIAFESVWVELLAGDPAAAAEFAAAGFRLHEESGGRGYLYGAAGSVAEALYALDRLDEAEAWANRAAELSSGGDVWTDMQWRGLKALALARRGEHAQAQRLAREAISVGERTELLDQQGAAYAALGEVLALAGEVYEAANALEQALGRYERKENRVMARRVRTRLAELRKPAPRPS